MRRERSTKARPSRGRARRKQQTIGTVAQLGLLVVGLFFTGCPVGAALDDPEAYYPQDSLTVSTATSTMGVATTGAATTGAASTTGGAAFTACPIDDAMFTCQGSVCHGTPGVASAVTLGAGLDLFTTDRDTKLLNAPATYVGVADSSTCPAMTEELLINATSPDASFILTKLTDAPPCGDKMPVVGTLEAADADCIKQWVYYIAGGAAAADGAAAAQQTGIGGSSSF